MYEYFSGGGLSPRCSCAPGTRTVRGFGLSSWFSGLPGIATIGLSVFFFFFSSHYREFLTYHPGHLYVIRYCVLSWSALILILSFGLSSLQHKRRMPDAFQG